MAKLETYTKKIAEYFKINLEDKSGKEIIGAKVWQSGKNDGLSLEYCLNENNSEIIKFSFFDDLWQIKNDKENNCSLVYETVNQNKNEKIKKLYQIYQTKNKPSDIVYDSLVSLYSTDASKSTVRLRKENKIQMEKNIKQKDIEELIEYFKILLS